ncbi:GNAT family N-acetyltransferase [Arthrobacter sp. RAF14]|uniref:GNAT family N-acetyltransferase n=1 Tax=Arthrobacter sp. RAF14 TaxID=3233051 RepID=UPI003F8E6432
MSMTANSLTAPVTVPATAPAPAGDLEVTVVQVALGDPRVQPLLEELAVEYSTRYGDFFSAAGAQEELSRYPASEFEPPHGALLILQQGEETVAGGAFRRYDAETAEFKRIWTHSAHRRKGLARRVLVELERAARERGYTRVYLTTGPRQPEAKSLYLATGYTPLFDLDADPEEVKHLAFTKPLPEA